MDKETLELGKNIIGGLLYDQSHLRDVIEIVGDKPAFAPEHQRIYNTILSLFERGETINSTALYAVLPEKSHQVLLDCLPYDDFHGGPTYARLLIEHYIKTSLGRFGKEMLYRATKTDSDAFELMDWAEAGLLQLSTQASRNNFVLAEDAVERTIAHTKSLAMSGYTGITTGFKSVDEILGGLQPTDLAILAGRPSNGKSAFALDMAFFNAAKGTGVGFFSLEMSIHQLTVRLLSKMCHINGHRMNFGRLDARELEAMRLMGQKLRGLPLYYQDCAGISIHDLRAAARKMKHERSVDLIVVDYLQLISGNRKDTREQEISSISRTLKSVAKELSTPVLCLSQLSRALQARVDKKPILSDLRDSGAIEQDADIVIFIHSMELSDQHRDIIVAKHRMGPLGETRLEFRSEFSEFV